MKMGGAINKIVDEVKDETIDISIDEFRQIAFKALENFRLERHNILDVYTEKEIEKREKWNNKWYVPFFLKRTVDKKRILDIRSAGSVSKMLDHPSLYAHLCGKVEEKYINEVLGRAELLKENVVKVKLKYWSSIYEWSNKNVKNKYRF